MLGEWIGTNRHNFLWTMYICRIKSINIALFDIIAAVMLFSLFIMPQLKVDPEEYQQMLEEKDKLAGALTRRPTDKNDNNKIRN